MLKTRAVFGVGGQFRILAILVMFVFSIFALAAEGSSKNAEAATLIHPLLIGAKVPDGTLADHEGQEIKLSQIIAKQPTILVFYRGGW